MSLSINKMKKKRFVFLMCFVLGVNFSFAQKWLFEIKPGFKYLGTTFFKTSGLITNSTSNIYAFHNMKKFSKLLIEPEIFIDLCKLNRKWQFGLGLTTYSWDEGINSSGTGKSYLLNTDSSLIYTEYISKKLTVHSLQYLVTATRTFRTNTFLDKMILNKLVFGVGINNLSRFNTRNEKEIYTSYLVNGQNYLKEITYNKSSTFGVLCPVLMFKYELTIMNRRNDFGILNFTMSYIQGFSNNYQFSLTSSNSSGANMVVNANTLGSGFRLGISKTFCYEQKLKTPIE
jgi:hypothetical protein